MEQYKLGAMESRFADLIWENAPLSSGELVRICEKELEWKKSTTYTMLRRLCQRGIFQMENSRITVLMSREEFMGKRSRSFIAETFGGSLPAFLVAFTGGRKLSQQDADLLQKLIDESRKEEKQ